MQKLNKNPRRASVFDKICIILTHLIFERAEMKSITGRTAAALSLALTTVELLFCILCVSVVYWVKLGVDNDSSYTGLFLKQSLANNDVNIVSNCDSSMSDQQCSYLKSAKAAAIISILFGGVGGFLAYFYLRYEFRTISGLSFFIIGLFIALQFVFLIICVVVFSYFNDSYLTINDDLNVEYPPDNSAEYAWGYNLMIAATVFTFIHSCGLFYFSRAKAIKRSPSSEGLFGFEK